MNDIKDALDISLKLGNDRITGLLLGALCQKRASKDFVVMISDYIHNTLIWFRLGQWRSGLEHRWVEGWVFESQPRQT